MSPQRRTYQAANLLLALIFLFSLIFTQPALAAPQPVPPPQTGVDPAGDGPRKGYNPETGMLNFVGGSADAPLAANRVGASAAGVQTAADQALGAYAGGFGIQDPARELALQKTDAHEQGTTLRYQQQYNGIPVMGGELLVNSDSSGNIVSLSGEASPRLALKTTRPAISAEAALTAAQAGMKEWYGLAAGELKATQPALWVYDERLFGAGDRPPVLAWRIDLEPSKELRPINELVLVDATGGKVLEHFNQVDAVKAETKPAEQDKTDLGQQTGATYYVSTTGSDFNTCISPDSPCATISYVLQFVTPGDTIKVASGVYPASVQKRIKLGNKRITLSGGWDETFETQVGFSTLDGENGEGGMGTEQCYSYCTADIILSNFIITRVAQGYSPLVLNDGYFKISNVSVHHNRLSGIAINNATVTITNTTISDNTGKTQGAGIYISEDSTVTLKNDTITRNTLSQASNAGSGLYIAYYWVYLTISNTIIAGNDAGGNLDISTYTYFPEATSLGHNLFGSINENSMIIPADTDLVGQPAGLSPYHPMGYSLPLPGSPALDGGSPADPESETGACSVVDQLGQTRPSDGNQDGTARCDIGAVEALPISSGERLLAWSDPEQTAATGKPLPQPLSVLAIDASSAPLAGIPVNFSLTSGPGGQFENSDPGTITVITDEQGIATAPNFTTAETPGLTILEAGTDQPDIPKVTFEIETEQSAPGYVIPVAGSKQTTALNTAFPARLQARVLDQYRQPVSGAEVTFSAPDSGPYGVFSDSGTTIGSAITGEDGIATAPELAANSVSGKYEIIATVPGAARPAHFILINENNLYVSPSGWNSNHPYENDCRNPGDPCKTISWALKRSTPGAIISLTEETVSTTDTINVSTGPVSISGGWNQDFTRQVGFTTIKAYSLSIPSTCDLTLSNVIFWPKNSGSNIKGKLNFTNGGYISPYILQNDGETTLTNVTFSSTADYAITNTQKLNLLNVTITGAKKAGFNNTGSLTIQNTLLAKNKAICANTGTILSNGHNLFDQNITCSGYPASPLNGDIYGVDPGLTTIINNQYFALLPGSPAVDQIDPAEPGAFCPATDQRGVSRPANGKCDIGAYEYMPHGAFERFVVLSGDDQKFGVGVVMPKRLTTQALDANGTPVPGIPVHFEIPETAQSSFFFENWEKTWTAITDESGAGASSLLLNSAEPGSYEVTARAEGAAQPLVFHITAADATLFVDPVNGSNSAYCRGRINPCKDLRYALFDTQEGELIKIASGLAFPGDSYQYYQTGKNFAISGGWNSDFTERTGQTALQGYYGFPAFTSAFVSVRNLDMASGFNHPALSPGQDGVPSTFVMMDGAIYNSGVAVENKYQNELWLTNVTIAENDCNQENSCKNKAVILNNGGAIHLNHVTMAENHTQNSKNYRLPVLTFPISGTGKVFIQNSLIAQNYHNGYANPNDLPQGENVTSLGHNFIDIGGSLALAPAEGDIFGTRANLVYARLDYSQKATGQTIQLRPLAGSPALDAAGEANCPAHDQQGSPRPAGATCDIGAVEGPGPAETRTIRMTYIPHAGENLPGIFRCGSSKPGCTDSADTEVDSAHRLSAEFDLFMRTYLHRNGVDDQELPFVSTAQYPVDKNAFWNGRQAVFGYRYALADDVVAHEFAHGINTFTAHLINFYQSGAINEALSDIWAEYYDAHDAEEGETANDAWLIGEGLPDGAIRSLKNPPDYQQPDRMTSPLYKKTYLDSGGVHTNSGVGNKAFYLMVEGGTFNKRAVAPLGWQKTAAVIYYAERFLLTSGANYSDLYQALNQSCRVQAEAGQGLTAEDCQQVLSATLAVEMNLEPKTAVTPDADFCPSGRSMDPANLFFDDFENGDGQWAFDAILQEPHWSVVPGDVNFYYAASGLHALFGNDYNDFYGGEDQISDSYAVWKQAVQVPKGTSTYLHFKHSFAFEFTVFRSKNYYFDGGFLEYSTDLGAHWKDAYALRDGGKPYTGSIYSYTYRGHNPLPGRRGFVGDSYGYVSTRYNLSSLAGKAVLFRWRVSTDYTGYRIGWLVDDVRVYNCVANPPAPVLTVPGNGLLLDTYRPRLAWKPVTSAVQYELQVATDKTFNQLVANPTGLTQPEYPFGEDLPENGLYYWRARATNRIGAAGIWSTVWSFRTRLRQPAPESPANHESWKDLRPRFTWSAIPGAASYSIEISPKLTFQGALTGKVTATSYSPAKDLPAGKTLYWRVRANGANPSIWSETRDFTTPIPPGTPRLISPGMNALVTTPAAVLLKWSAATVPTGAPAFASYSLQVDDTADFTSLLYEKDGLTANQFTLPDVLPANSKIYWRVRALNVNGEFAWWSSAYFRTPRLAP